MKVSSNGKCVTKNRPDTCLSQAFEVVGRPTQKVRMLCGVVGSYLGMSTQKIQCFGPGGNNIVEGLF